MHVGMFLLECMYAYIHMCMPYASVYACMHVDMHACMSVDLYACEYAPIIWVSMLVCVYAFMFVRCVHMHVFLHACTYIYVHSDIGMFKPYGLTFYLSDGCCLIGTSSWRTLMHARFFIMVQVPPSSGMFRGYTHWGCFEAHWLLRKILRKKLSKIENREWRPVGSNPHRLFVRCRYILLV